VVVVLTDVNVAGQLSAVLEAPETDFEEIEEESLDQRAQALCAETPVAATARAAEVVNFIFIVLCHLGVTERVTGFWLSPRTENERQALRPRTVKGKEWIETSKTRL